MSLEKILQIIIPAFEIFVFLIKQMSTHYEPERIKKNAQTQPVQMISRRHLEGRAGV
jgi:hypothetical protein